MASQPFSLRRNIALIAAWAICLPALVCWPFLSAMPAFALLGGGEPYEIATQALFFSTGFWPLALMLLGAAVVSRGMGAPRGLGRRSAGLAIGAYALAWTALYGIATFALR